MLEGINDWDKGQLITLSVLIAVLLFSSFAIRGTGFVRTIRMLLAWAAIFALVFIAATYREDTTRILGDIRGRVTGELDPASGVATADGFRIRARQDGHFWVRARVNGEPVLFIVDTGATDIVLGHDAARRLGIDVSKLSYNRIAMTANGAIRAGRAPLGVVEVGPIARSGLRASITERDSGVNLLGMSFLRTLSGWRVERDTLIMTP